MNYLQAQFPLLKDILPTVSLGTFPTPVKRLENLSRLSNANNLFVKCDDCSGALYGGNKIRKLEYLFADARKANAKRLIASGMIGSNHALATALYGIKNGFNVLLMLMGEQRGSHVVNNLIADFQSGAEIHYDKTFEEQQRSIDKYQLMYKEKDGVDPYVIPAGGSSVIGTIGYINAALELKKQIENGDLTEPDAIILPFGTMGTAAGLLAGIKIAGLKSKIVPVQVVPSFVADEKKYLSLVYSVTNYLHSLRAGIPNVTISSNDYHIEKEYLGTGYGVSTLQGEEAIVLFDSNESIQLDSVYSGKAAAAFIRYAFTEKNKNLLFWNTKNSVSLHCENYETNAYPQWFQQLLDLCK